METWRIRDFEDSKVANRRVYTISQLVNQLEAELNLAGGASRAADEAKPRAANDIRGQTEIDQVEDIEKLGAELECQRLAAPASELRILNQRHVEVVEGGAAEGVAAQDSEAALVRPRTPRNTDGDIEE